VWLLVCSHRIRFGGPWHDADGYEGSPLPQLGDAVQGDPVSISWTRDWIVVGGAIVIGASITLWLVM
jgi:hypothetical protein